MPVDVTEETNQVVVSQQSLGSVTITEEGDNTVVPLTTPAPTVTITEEASTVQVVDDSVASVVISEADTPVQVTQETVSVISVSSIGPQGPPGAPGADGTGGDLHYIYDQSTPASTWTITHNLGKFPAVTVVDSAGTEITGDIEHTSMNSTVLTFTTAFGGKAYFN